MTVCIKKNGSENVVLKIINSFQEGGKKINTIDKGDGLYVENSDKDFFKAVKETESAMNWNNVIYQ